MTALGFLLALVSRVVFAFADPAIDESSGLVDLGATMVTTDDSGGDALVFVVDARTGRTVGHTTYADGVVDVEALAPAGVHAVWVGDIGDNTEQRRSVRVYRVDVRRGDRRVDAPSYELVYPDGPHDAESLVATTSGRLYVVTKGLLGGTAYAVPRHLDPTRVNRLLPVAPVDVWATDAALFPDERHLLVRTYDSAAVYTFPGFRPVASLDLPTQRQGEGVSIAATGRVRLSSEGVHSRVLQIELPDAVRAVVQPEPASARGAGDAVRIDDRRSGRSAVPTALVVGGTLVVVLALGGGIRILRRRTR